MELRARAAELQTRLNEALFHQEALRAEKDLYAAREQTCRIDAASAASAASARSEQLARALASAQERCRVLQARLTSSKVSAQQCSNSASLNISP